MTEQPRGRSRSLLVLAMAAVLGTGIGLLGALLRPAPVPESSPTSLVIRGEQSAAKLDIGKIQHALLERLVAQAAKTEKPEQLPDFDNFLRVFKRDPQRRSELLDRLTSTDVPPSLRLSFAKRTPSQPAQQQQLVYRRLVAPLLDSEDDEVQLSAAEALMAAGQLKTHRSPACRCRFGYYPGEDINSQNHLVAWTLDEDGGLLWSPTALHGEVSGWDLRLKRLSAQEQGDPVLFLALDLAPQGGQVIAENGLSGPRLVVAGAD